MITWNLALTMCVAGAAPLPPAPPKLPSGPAPKITVVAEVRAETGDVTCTECSTKAELVTRPVTVAETVMGKTVTKTVLVTEMRQVPETRLVRYPLKGTTAQTADGKALTKDDVIKKLTPGTPLLIVTGSDKVDPAYLKIIRPDAVILFVTPAMKKAEGVPVPPPPPPRRP